MAKKDYSKPALALHKKLQGKVRVVPAAPVKNLDDLALVYTPGVGAVSSYVAENPKKAREYTMKGRVVAVVSDGSAVLGLGNIGALGALPVMEGKAALFKTFGGVDAVPLVLSTQNADEIVETVMRIAPGFGGINLEDIAAPKCFEIEEKLIERLDIPVMHDDQHGTAIVVLAGLINAMKVVKKDMNQTTIVVSGVGAAGVAIMKLLRLYAPKATIIGVDSSGAISSTRSDLNPVKRTLLESKVLTSREGDLGSVVKGSDVFLGVSKPGVLTSDMVRNMNPGAVIFAMANPVPEIMPDVARKAGAAVVATGRSDFPNQVNNSLAFPGVFRGALDNRVTRITETMKIKAAKALAGLITKPTAGKILPSMFDKKVAPAVARVIR